MTQDAAAGDGPCVHDLSTLGTAVSIEVFFTSVLPPIKTQTIKLTNMFTLCTMCAHLLQPWLVYHLTGMSTSGILLTMCSSFILIILPYHFSRCSVIFLDACTTLVVPLNVFILDMIPPCHTAHPSQHPHLSALKMEEFVFF